MVEGNFSSLLLFLQDVINDAVIPCEFTERLSRMQSKVEVALIKAEQTCRRNISLEKTAIKCAVLSLLEAWDETVFIELFGILFPLNKKVCEALTLRGSDQLREVSDYVIATTSESDMIQRANLLKEFSARLHVMPVGEQNHIL